MRQKITKNIKTGKQIVCNFAECVFRCTNVHFDTMSTPDCKYRLVIVKVSKKL